MNNLRQKILFGSATVAMLGFSGVQVRAGEKIIISDNNAKAADPTEQRKVKSDLFKSFNKLDQPVFNYELLGIPTLPRGLSRKEEKRLENKRIEEKNWIWVDSGELQRKEEEKSIFGDNTDTDE